MPQHDEFNQERRRYDSELKGLRELLQACTIEVNRCGKDVAVVLSRMERLTNDVRALDDKVGKCVSRETFDEFRDDCVSTKEYEPVRKLVYGFAALALTSVVTALLALVVMK